MKHNQNTGDTEKFLYLAGSAGGKYAVEKLWDTRGTVLSSLSVNRKSARHPRNDCTAAIGMSDDGGCSGFGIPPT